MDGTWKEEEEIGAEGEEYRILFLFIYLIERQLFGCVAYLVFIPQIGVLSSNNCNRLANMASVCNVSFAPVLLLH